MAYKAPWPAFQYTQPNISQPADPYSQLMAYYQNYGYGPEQQFFSWGDLYDPAKYGKVRPGWEGQVAGLAQAGQQQQQPAPQQQQVPDSLISWWTHSGSDMYNPNRK